MAHMNYYSKIIIIITYLRATIAVSNYTQPSLIKTILSLPIWYYLIIRYALYTSQPLSDISNTIQYAST